MVGVTGSIPVPPTIFTYILRIIPAAEKTVVLGVSGGRFVIVRGIKWQRCPRAERGAVFDQWGPLTSPNHWN